MGRPPDRTDPTFLSDEAGVSEVVGFIFMFAMAFVVLTLSMAVVSDRVRKTTDDSRRARFAEVGSELASAIREAVAFSDLHPDARFERTVSAPRETGGVAAIVVTETTVHVNTSQATDDLHLQFGGFDLGGEELAFERTAIDARHIQVSYRSCPATGATGPCTDEPYTGDPSVFVDETRP